MMGPRLTSEQRRALDIEAVRHESTGAALAIDQQRTAATAPRRLSSQLHWPYCSDVCHQDRRSHVTRPNRSESRRRLRWPCFFPPVRRTIAGILLRRQRCRSQETCWTGRGLIVRPLPGNHVRLRLEATPGRIPQAVDCDRQRPARAVVIIPRSMSMHGRMMCPCRRSDPACGAESATISVLTPDLTGSSGQRDCRAPGDDDAAPQSRATWRARQGAIIHSFQSRAVVAPIAIKGDGV